MPRDIKKNILWRKSAVLVIPEALSIKWKQFTVMLRGFAFYSFNCRASHKSFPPPFFLSLYFIYSYMATFFTFLIRDFYVKKKSAEESMRLHHFSFLNHGHLLRYSFSVFRFNFILVFVLILFAVGRTKCDVLFYFQLLVHYNNYTKNW